MPFTPEQANAVDALRNWQLYSSKARASRDLSLAKLAQLDERADPSVVIPQRENAAQWSAVLASLAVDIDTTMSALAKSGANLHEVSAALGVADLVPA